MGCEQVVIQNFVIVLNIVTYIPIARQRLGKHMPAINTPQQ
jgi:hypothetical protein